MMGRRPSSQSSVRRTASRPLIYVVDDEPMLLDLARSVLEAEGYDVRIYRDPSAALLAFRRARSRPVLILTDYQMRKMNGLELTAAFRKLDPRQRVILVSGMVSTDLYPDSVDRPDAFLSKPFSTQGLSRLVRQLLGNIQNTH